MPAEESNEFFGHLNNPATPRRTRRPSSSGMRRPSSGQIPQVPDPFAEDVVDAEHPLSTSGQSALLPERGRARTRAFRQTGLVPGMPQPDPPPEPREKPDSDVELTTAGVKRIRERRPTSDIIEVPGIPDQPKEEAEKTDPPPQPERRLGDGADVAWEQYVAADFPAMEAEEFGVKTKRTDSGRIVPVALRADLTDEALKDQSIKGGKRGRKLRPAKKDKSKRGAPKSFWQRIGQTLRLTRPEVQDVDDESLETDVREKPTRGGFARSGSMKSRATRQRKTPLGMAWSVIVEVAKILLLVLLLRAYVVQVSQVQGPSMEGTLAEGDRLVVERITPLMFNNRETAWFSWLPDFLSPELHRGDIVVVRSPEDPGLELVKRLIALPGDTLKFQDGALWLKPKGALVFEKVSESYLSSDELKREDGTFRSYTLGDLGSEIEEGKETLVPAGRIFVMGDNRQHSNDSRRWLEIDVRRTEPANVDRLWAHTTSVEGRVIFRIWPLDRIWPPVK